MTKLAGGRPTRAGTLQLFRKLSASGKTNDRKGGSSGLGFERGKGRYKNGNGRF